jgi:hypothetical protein
MFPLITETDNKIFFFLILRNFQKILPLLTDKKKLEQGFLEVLYGFHILYHIHISPSYTAERKFKI